MEEQNMITYLGSVFTIALIISYILTPYARRLACKLGAIDVPKDNRRVHKKPTPSLGGVAIYISFIITIAIFAVFNKGMNLNSEFKGILMGATLILITGIIDDIKQVPAVYKLAIQILAALIAVHGGVTINFIKFPPANTESGLIFLKALRIPMTVFWIIGITNTVNLIDGLDGLAAGVSTIASLSLAAVAYNVGQYNVAILLAILAGASLGFLPYNFNPAQIFMGDAGSLVIGYLLATISVEGAIKSATTIAVATPVLALGVPVFDTAFAIVRRLVNKKPIMEADKGHLHHRLLDHGLTQKQTVLILYIISSLLGGSSIIISDVAKPSAYLIIGVISILILYGAYRIGIIKKVAEKKGAKI
ncbi:MAG TPA: MraY family glycosyltransferase [Clostridia bacterium]|nr:MraY family glycosyltransferase [Clostridia bacterium]